KCRCAPIILVQINVGKLDVLTSTSGGRKPGCRGVPQDGHASRKRPSTARKQLFGSLMLSEVKKLWRPTAAWFANDDPCRPREPVHLEGVRSMWSMGTPSRWTSAGQGGRPTMRSRSMNGSGLRDSRDASSK